MKYPSKIEKTDKYNVLEIKKKKRTDKNTAARKVEARNV
jgi:hypothetical protein